MKAIVSSASEKPSRPASACSAISRAGAAPACGYEEPPDPARAGISPKFRNARAWPASMSTGIASSPTFVGTFQVLSKEDSAYASSWDLWMPNFLGIYESGPDFTNGIHALPILSSGARLWEGYLGRPVSYGCIVLGVEEAAALYDWAELGTMVVIQD